MVHLINYVLGSFCEMKLLRTVQSENRSAGRWLALQLLKRLAWVLSEVSILSLKNRRQKSTVKVFCCFFNVRQHIVFDTIFFYCRRTNVLDVIFIPLRKLSSQYVKEPRKHLNKIFVFSVIEEKSQ